MSSPRDENEHQLPNEFFEPEGRFDVETFKQILDMDDDSDNRAFSQELVVDFLNQAQETFEKIQTALDNKNLNELSDLGHFLKGSSAALGLAQISHTCALIQDYGKKSKETSPGLTDEEALKLIANALKDVWSQYEQARTVLAKFYNLEEGSDSEEESSEEDGDEEDGEGEKKKKE